MPTERKLERQVITYWYVQDPSNTHTYTAYPNRFKNAEQFSRWIESDDKRNGEYLGRVNATIERFK